MSKKCPKCLGPTQLNGIRNGVQGWRCPKCGAAGYDTTRKQGGQLGDTLPVSGADRARKCREKKKKAKDSIPILQPKINMQLRIRSCQEESPKNTTYADRFYALAASRGETPIGVYINARTKVEIKCKNGHLFMMNSSHYKQGHGCPKCARASTEQGEVRFFALLKANGETAQSSYAGSMEKIELKCKNGHRFMTTPSRYKQGHGCPKCSGQCPEQAKEDFYALLKTNGETSQNPYAGSMTKIGIKCKNGHLSMKTPNAYKQGAGCKECHLNKRFPNRAPTSLSTIGRTLINPPE